MLEALYGAVGHRPIPWRVRQEMVCDKWRWLWPHLLVAVPFWESTGPTRELVTDRPMAGWTPTWVTQPKSPQIVKPVASTVTDYPTASDHASYRRATYEVTLMALLYRPTSGVSAPNYDMLLGKAMAAPSYSSYQLFNNSTINYQYMFAVSTTTTDNNFTNMTNADVGNVWRWVVGRWRSASVASSLIQVRQYDLGGTVIVGDNGGASPATGTIKYDTNGLTVGIYDGYYGAAYAFSRLLTDSQVKDIIRDPWGLVRPGYAVGTAAALTGTGGGGGTGARSFIAGMVG